MIEIIAVGDEVLRGEVHENNSDYISRALTSAGIEPWKITVLPDDIKILAAELKEAITRSDVVVVTGGLGPTADDVTKEAAVEALGCRTEFRERIVIDIASRFRDYGMEMPEGYRKQAVVPEGALVLSNTVGLAVGLKLFGEDFKLYLLPGVPAEMRDMFDRCVLPDLSAAGVDARVRLRTFALVETEVEERVSRVSGGELQGRISIISGPSGVDVYLPADLARGGLIADIERELGSYLYTTGDSSLAEVVTGLLMESGKTLSTAESLTGGLLAGAVVSVPGASNSFMEGFVTYSNNAKIERIGVDASLFAEHGAVSGEVCIAMASGARRFSRTDFALSTTGIAGPGGQTENKPVGLCYLGLAAPRGLFCRRLHLSGDREMVRHRAVHWSLDLLRLELEDARDRLEPFKIAGAQ